MRIVIFVTIILTVSACHKPEHRYNEITKVELAHDTSILNKGTIIGMDSSLNYNFHRYHRFLRHPEKDQSIFYKGKVAASFWDTLNSKFEKIHYKTLDTIYKFTYVDGESYELIIYWKNGRKRIVHPVTSESDSLKRILDWLDSSYKNVNLKQTNTPFKFETTGPIPPKKKIDQVKFPSPVKKTY